MGRFLVKRILSVIPVLFVVSVVVFLLVHLVPGDPAAAMLGDMATEADIAALRERMGLWSGSATCSTGTSGKAYQEMKRCFP